MTQPEFGKLVFQALISLPKNIRQAVDNVAIVVEQWPTPVHLEKLGTRLGNNLLGLYQGVPKTTWGRSFGHILPDKITIFQGPIEKLAASDEEVKELVKIVVWHEVAHHFGMDDKKIRQLEAKWRRKV